MSDLSWLNPAPHAIAVYASQPLSPVATQHSLPAGRYPLLGPDFHRLDRTSFAWRTHSITSSAPTRIVSQRAAFHHAAVMPIERLGRWQPSSPGCEPRVPHSTRRRAPGELHSMK